MMQMMINDDDGDNDNDNDYDDDNDIQGWIYEKHVQKWLFWSSFSLTTVFLWRLVSEVFL